MKTTASWGTRPQRKMLRLGAHAPTPKSRFILALTPPSGKTLCLGEQVPHPKKDFEFRAQSPYHRGKPKDMVGIHVLHTWWTPPRFRVRSKGAGQTVPVDYSNRWPSCSCTRYTISTSNRRAIFGAICGSPLSYPPSSSVLELARGSWFRVNC